MHFENHIIKCPIFLHNSIVALVIAKLFTLIEFNSYEPRFGCSLVPWTWWALQNWTFKGKVMNGSRFSWANFLFWFFSKWPFCRRHLLDTYRHCCWRCLFVVVIKWRLWQQKKIYLWKIFSRKSWSVGNFAFKCSILKCSSCSRDQTTAETRFIWHELDGGKKFWDI